MESCKKTSADVYCVRNGYEWADIGIREWIGGGSIMVDSSFGAFAHRWTHIADCDAPLRKFLCNTDKAYFFDKCVGSACKVLDCQKTAREIRREILQSRKHGGLTAEDARTLWDGAKKISMAHSFSDMSELMGQDDFDELLAVLYENDYGRLPTVYSLSTQYESFWSEIWPIVCGVWRKELGL